MNPRTVVLAALAAAIVTLPSSRADARRHAGTFGPLASIFCGDRYCGVESTFPGARRASTGHRRAKVRRKAKDASVRHPATVAAPWVDPSSVALPLPRSRPVLAAVDAPEPTPAPVRNLLKAFREEVARIVEPVRPGFVAIRTASGRRAVVAQAAAARFVGFLRGLEATGYRIKEIGGYAYRRIAGTRTLSKHAFGLAIDVNQLERNRVSVRMNGREVSRIASANGLCSGGDWRRPDLGHFEVCGASPHRRHRVRYASFRR